MSAIIWGRLLGFIGLLLAIPLSAIGKVYFQRHFLIREEIEKTTKNERAGPSKKNNRDE